MPVSSLRFLKLWFPFEENVYADVSDNLFTNSAEHQKVPLFALLAIREVRLTGEPK